MKDAETKLTDLMSELIDNIMSKLSNGQRHILLIFNTNQTVNMSTSFPEADTELLLHLQACELGKIRMTKLNMAKTEAKSETTEN